MTVTTVNRRQLMRWIAWFSLWSALLIMLVFGRYLHYMDWPDSALGWSYLLTTVPGHAFFLVLLLLPVSWVLAALIPNEKLLKIWLVSVSGLGLSLLVLDSLVFDQYRFHINGFVISLLVNDKDGQIFDFSFTSQLMAITGVLVVFAVQWFAAGVIWKKQTVIQRHARLRYLLPACFLLTLSSHFIHAYADALYRFDVTKQARYYPVHYPTTANRQLAKWGVSDPEAAERAELMRLSEGALSYPVQPLACVAADEPENLLIITVDSWRFDTADSATAPNVAAFAKEYGTRFNRHYSGGNGTRSGIFSIFYGIPGTYWDAMKSSATPPVLMTQLQQQGYQLGIFANANLTSPAFDKTVFASVENLRLETEAANSPQRDIKLTDEWLQWLDQQQQSDKPFFGFLFYDAPHSYSAPEGYPQVFSPVWDEVNYLKLNNEFDPEPYFNRYKNAVHFTDSQIGRVLDDLKQRGLLDNTRVVITADHGQEFNDLGKNYWGHGGNFSDYQVRVPLIIAGAGFTPGAEVDRRTSHFDLPPTLMQDTLGCSSPVEHYSSGQHILKGGERRWVIAGSPTNYGIVQKDKITVTYHSGMFEVLDPEYRPKQSSELDMGVMSEVMKEQGRFYQ